MRCSTQAECLEHRDSQPSVLNCIATSIQRMNFYDKRQHLRTRYQSRSHRVTSRCMISSRSPRTPPDRRPPQLKVSPDVVAICSPMQPANNHLTNLPSTLERSPRRSGPTRWRLYDGDMHVTPDTNTSKPRYRVMHPASTRTRSVEAR